MGAVAGECSVLALADTQTAFDSVAADYDRSNQDNPALVGMRRRSLARLRQHGMPGARVLDLGCGPGTDAEVLGRAGYHVTAIDWSPAMVRETEARVARAHLTDVVTVRHLGIQDLARLESDSFDLALSNFGPLNCVPDLREAARLVAARLRPGGVLVASVIGRICPWEIAVFGARGDWRRLAVRFARSHVPVPLNGHTVWTRYYSPTAFARVFEAAGFERLSLEALGLFAPPPYLLAFAARHPRTVARLQRADEYLGRLPGFCRLGDHFLIAMRNRRSARS
jgi:SAM-dependent methyltransferase